MKTLTEKEKEIVNKLNDRLYTVEFLEEWINRCNKFINKHKECREDIAYWGFEYGDYQSWLDYYGIKEEFKDEKDDAKR